MRSKDFDDVGYIRITAFNEQTETGLERAIRDRKSKSGDKLKGYVIDLRNNPGGLLDQAVAVSEAFLDKGEIVSTRARRPEDSQRFNAKPGDLVIYCPDQLGPSTARELDDLPVEQLTFPRLEGPERVDWVDYKSRQDKVDPDQFARKVLDRADGHQIFYAFYDGYSTSKKTCPAILNAFSRERPAEQLSSDTSSYEPAYLYRFVTAPAANAGG